MDRPRMQMDRPRKKNWWAKNWKGLLPTGCLSGLVLFLAFIALIISFVFGIMKSSDAYKEALATARASPAVEAALGTPLEEGFFITGNISVSGSSGNASLAIPVSGPKGEGTLFVVAVKSAGRWSFMELILEVERTKQRIDLLAERRE